MGKQKTRECAYCGQVIKITRDHVIPECLFTQPYPLNLITVPSCQPCNVSKSDDDDFLRDLVVTDVYGNQHTQAQDLFKTKFLSSAKQNSSDVAQSMLTEAVGSAFYSHGGIYLGHAVTAPIDQDRLKAMFGRIVRGLHFYFRKKRIPDDFTVEVRRYHPRQFREVYNLVAETGHLRGPHIYGDVFQVAYIANEDPFACIWFLWFFNSVCLTVSVSPPGTEDGLSEPTRSWGAPPFGDTEA